MVIDAITFNGESDLFDLRYNVLKEYVDEFIVIEFDTTFSGATKEPSFPYDEYPDVTYCFNTEKIWSKYNELAALSPQTQGAMHWKTEFAQKESIKDCLTHLNDKDIVFIGDVDEMWSPSALKHRQLPLKLKLGVYTYYLNNRSTEEFWGTLMATYGQIKGQTLNHLRQNAPKSKHLNGWHFTSMKDKLHKKLTDSYTHDSYATPEVLNNLAYNIEHNKDFLGRNFEYTLDETGWPTYLKENREKYKHLLKQTQKISTG